MTATTNPRCLYQHPEGPAIVLHADDHYLACHYDLEGDPDDFTMVNIGPDGLVALGLVLIAAGHAMNVSAKGGE